ncbi:secreted protein [Candidatus Magnetobacterium bavaricum]|uniref:Secreted protein n=1 Tax=Candidatus Magnetobacterium bavaricum TaxID=29290 RepID=A0A0F3H3K3_9BACT|nr:secreted protein [Candidatus Magnetobacterium bavaricum]
MTKSLTFVRVPSTLMLPIIPSSLATLFVGNTSGCKLSIRHTVTSMARASFAPINTPNCLGVPPVPGPSPSIANMPSSMFMAGLSVMYIYNRSWAKWSLLSPILKCHCGFLMPTTQPNKFLTARVMPICIWVFSFGRFMMQSASSACRASSVSLNCRPSTALSPRRGSTLVLSVNSASVTSRPLSASVIPVSLAIRLNLPMPGLSITSGRAPCCRTYSTTARTTSGCVVIACSTEAARRILGLMTTVLSAAITPVSRAVRISKISVLRRSYSYEDSLTITLYMSYHNSSHLLMLSPYIVL